MKKIKEVLVRIRADIENILSADVTKETRKDIVIIIQKVKSKLNGKHKGIISPILGAALFVVGFVLLATTQDQEARAVPEEIVAEACYYAGDIIEEVQEPEDTEEKPEEAEALEPLIVYNSQVVAEVNEPVLLQSFVGNIAGDDVESIEIYLNDSAMEGLMEIREDEAGQEINGIPALQLVFAEPGFYSLNIVLLNDEDQVIKDANITVMVVPGEEEPPAYQPVYEPDVYEPVYGGYDNQPDNNPPPTPDPPTNPEPDPQPEPDPDPDSQPDD